MVCEDNRKLDVSQQACNVSLMSTAPARIGARSAEASLLVAILAKLFRYFLVSAEVSRRSTVWLLDQELNRSVPNTPSTLGLSIPAETDCNRRFSSGQSAMMKLSFGFYECLETVDLEEFFGNDTSRHPK